MRSEAPRILVRHDGELEDVCALLRELHLAHADTRGPDASEEPGAYPVVVVTPEREAELQWLRAPDGLSIVVVPAEVDVPPAPSHASQWIVRRPVDSGALRALLIHTAVGNERRRARRFSLSVEITYREGLWRRRGVLEDLSIHGGRIRTARAVRPGARLRIRLPRPPGGEAAPRLAGFVLRSELVPAGQPGRHAFAFAVDGLRGGEERVLEEWGEAWLRSAPAEDTASDRRGEERRRYERHVIALGDATRVLLGKDISSGGMRVDPASGLGVGQEVQLALHVRPGEVPLVVRAAVLRDDGDGGLGLRFVGLDASARDYLDKMVRSLPPISLADENGNAEGRVVATVVGSSGDVAPD